MSKVFCSKVKNGTGRLIRFSQNTFFDSYDGLNGEIALLTRVIDCSVKSSMVRISFLIGGKQRTGFFNEGEFEFLDEAQSDPPDGSLQWIFSIRH